MTSLLDRPITAASDDGVCRWHAAKLWETRKIIEIKFDFHHSANFCQKHTPGNLKQTHVHAQFIFFIC